MLNLFFFLLQFFHPDRVFYIVRTAISFNCFPQLYNLRKLLIDFLTFYFFQYCPFILTSLGNYLLFQSLSYYFVNIVKSLLLLSKVFVLDMFPTMRTRKSKST